MSKANPIPQPIEDLADSLASLPGIGPKLANRLAIYLAVRGESLRDNLIKLLTEVKSQVKECEHCHNLATSNICTICSNEERDPQVVLVVENVLDLLQIERGGDFNGLYFVLGGLISPINGVGPQDLDLKLLLHRVESENVQEVILGLNSSLEAEATSLYVTKQLHNTVSDLKVTRLARGLSAGISLEFVDPTSLSGALSNRVQVGD
jgi:recombination protein RecR